MYQNIQTVLLIMTRGFSWEKSKQTMNDSAFSEGLLDQVLVDHLGDDDPNSGLDSLFQGGDEVKLKKGLTCFQISDYSSET